MGCCGGSRQAPSQTRFQGPPQVTGYALDMPDGRVITYLTREQAEAKRDEFALATPVREVLGWR